MILTAVTPEPAICNDFFTSAIISTIETILNEKTGFTTTIETLGFSEESVFLYNVKFQHNVTFQPKKSEIKNSFKDTLKGDLVITIKKAALVIDQSALYSGKTPDIKDISAEGIKFFLFENKNTLSNNSKILTQEPDLTFNTITYNPLIKKNKKISEIKIAHKKNFYSVRVSDSENSEKASDSKKTSISKKASDSKKTTPYYSVSLNFVDTKLADKLIKAILLFSEFSGNSKYLADIKIFLKNKISFSRLSSFYKITPYLFSSTDLFKSLWFKNLINQSSISGTANILVSKTDLTKKDIKIKNIDALLENNLFQTKIKSTSSNVFSLKNKFKNIPLEKLFSLVDPSLEKGVSGTVSGDFSTIFPDVLYNPHINAQFKNIRLVNFKPITDNLMSTRDIQVNIGVLGLFTKNKNRINNMKTLMTQIYEFNQALEYVNIPSSNLKIKKIEQKNSKTSLQLVSGVSSGDNFVVKGSFKNSVPFTLEGFNLRATGPRNSSKTNSSPSILGNMNLSGSMRLSSAVLPGGLKSVTMRLGGTLLSPSVKYDYSPFLSLLTPIFTGKSSNSSTSTTQSNTSSDNPFTSQDTSIFKSSGNPFLQSSDTPKSSNTSETKKKKINPLELLINILGSRSKNK